MKKCTSLLPFVVLFLSVFSFKTSLGAQVFGPRQVLGEDAGLNRFNKRPIAADFNQDGAIDIIYGVDFDEDRGSFVYLNNNASDISFTLDKISGFINPYIAAVEDMNNDGLPDIVNDWYIGVNQNADTLVDNIFLFENPPGGFFISVKDVGNINDDVYPDCLYFAPLAFGNDQLGILLSTDSLEYELVKLDSTNSRITQMLFYDLDGNGRDELLFATDNPGEDELLIILEWQTDGSINRTEIAPPDFTPKFIGLADFNNDGNPELVYFDSFGGFYYLPNNEGVFDVNDQQVISNADRVLAASFADLNGDDLVDIVSLIRNPAQFDDDFFLVYRLNNGDGTFTPNVQIDEISGNDDLAVDAQSEVGIITLASLDEDVFPEIVLISPEDEQLLWYKNLTIINSTSEATLTEDHELVVSPNPTAGWFQLTPADKETLLQAVMIYNVEGELVYNHTAVKQPMLAIDASSWPAGVYIVKSMDIHGDQSVTKILKQ